MFSSATLHSPLDWTKSGYFYDTLRCLFLRIREYGVAIQLLAVLSCTVTSLQLSLVKLAEVAENDEYDVAMNISDGYSNGGYSYGDDSETCRTFTAAPGCLIIACLFAW